MRFREEIEGTLDFGRIDAIWSRCNAHDVEIERVACHFEIRSVDGHLRIISAVSVPTDKERLTDIFRY